MGKKASKADCIKKKPLEYSLYKMLEDKFRELTNLLKGRSTPEKIKVVAEEILELTYVMELVESRSEYISSLKRARDRVYVMIKDVKSIEFEIGSFF